ncbi:MAG: DJ-1/PfpI family protein [Nanoarchaeota archaeon]|nr:DJ-1/PfpI family protein [Nanoarchaeota archaeon]
MKKAVLIIAHRNFRDEELRIPLQILRDNSIICVIASTSLDMAKGSLGTEVKPDVLIRDVDPEDYDVIIFIGGPGAMVLAGREDVVMLLSSAEKKKKILAAICIAPAIFAKAGVLKDKKATVWKSDESISILEKGKAVFVDKPVVVDGLIVTANGPQAAEEFGEKIVEMLE